jgi:hypothetical protein
MTSMATGGPARLGSISIRSRMRLYLVDLPEGSATRILAIVVFGSHGAFESMVEAAAPVLDSFEFHAS